MLLEIDIHNIALIEALSVEFSPGFNVLTGETGAGKSIVVDSLNLALGGRADRELIRAGADRASVRALFDVSGNARAKALLGEMGLECEDGLVTVLRELTASGRNVCRVNGMLVPLAQLKRLTAQLADIHGQHEHQALMDPARHMGFVDAFGDGAHRELLQSVAEQYAQRMALAGEIKRALSGAASREREIEDLTRAVKEIEEARLKPGEEEALLKKNALLENAGRVQEALDTAYALIYDQPSNAQEALSLAAKAMAGIEELDARYREIRERVDEARVAVRELGRELGDLREEVEYDPALADRIADRLETIRRLEKRYGPELSDVLDYLADAKARLGALAAGEDGLEEKKKRLRAMDARLKADCARLTQSRKDLSEKLAAGILSHLRDLGMGKTRLEIAIRPAKITSTGGDDVEFLLSPNPGEALKPLSAIASGGEISRVMLAIKAVSMEEYGVDSMVFDEIDTGVSGRMAQAVGEKMAKIAALRQVLCVTHLPQIAALADRHFVVEKTVAEGRTGSNVRALDEEGRVREIARLVGGAEESASALAHARNLLEEAKARKRLLAERNG